MRDYRAGLVLSHRAERSVLDGPRAAELQPFAVGGRMRRATCSGVAWFRGRHLAAVNLYGGHLRIYRFHGGDDGEAGAPRLELLHEMTEGVRCPEDVAVSPDGRHLAITHSMSDDLGVSLHRLDAGSLAPDPAGRHLRGGRIGAAFHGVNFSPDSRHLAFTRIGEPAYVEVVRVDSPSGHPTCRLDSRVAPMQPKAVAFSRDGRYAAITMAHDIRPDPEPRTGGTLSIHRFDAATGVLEPEPMARLGGASEALRCPEMCTFLPTRSATRYPVLVADQAADAVAAFEFDAGAGALAFRGFFATGLDFPHGLEATADGRLVAITNYGDDTLRIARVRPDDPAG